MSAPLSGEPIPPRPDGLIPQPHGGALSPRGPASGGTSWKAAKKAALLEVAPAAGRDVRAWDLAATAQGGDWTAGVGCAA